MIRRPELRRVVLLAVIVIALALLAKVGQYYARALWIKSIGIELKPRHAYEPRVVPHFVQNDPSWQHDRLGDSAYTLGGHGCLVGALASALCSLGHDTTPKNLNEQFTSGGVYTGAGDVIWYMIDRTIPGIRYHYSRVFTSSMIEHDLRQGLLPVVMVKYHKSGIHHWVLIIGSNDRDFLVMDPLDQTRGHLELGTHGRVYAYRVLKRDQ